MRADLEHKLFNRFKFFHPERPPTECLMCFGFEHLDGWFQIIWDLCEELEPLINEAFEVIQVKEKYGILRFYTNFDGHDSVYTLISKAMKRSKNTCEICGKPGGMSHCGMWLKTLCAECRKEHDYEEGYPDFYGSPV